jgi:hypothetical protein
MSENSPYTKSIQLARKIWPDLVILAERRATISYQALGEQHGISGRALRSMGNILDPIKRYCQQYNLPQLNALVVRKDSELPGAGAEADESDIEEVFAFNWRSRSPLIPSEAELFEAMQK